MIIWNLSKNTSTEDDEYKYIFWIAKNGNRVVNLNVCAH